MLLFTRGYSRTGFFPFGSRQSFLIPARTAFRPGHDRAGSGERLFLHGSVPLHQKRLRSRGFNQSLLLAYQLLKNIKAKPSLLRPRVLRRVRETIPQTELPTERLAIPMMPLLWKIPCALEHPTHRRCDDTGSPNVAARTLKASGAERVSA